MGFANVDMSGASHTRLVKFIIQRFDPAKDAKPYMEEHELQIPEGSDMMLLQALEMLKHKGIKTMPEQEDGQQNASANTLAYRRSCGEGVCGSDGMNVNGKNMLACITPLSALDAPITIRPLPGLPIIRDLVVDMKPFFKQYEKIKPFLQNEANPPAKERLQSPEERAKLDGLYECILCACCTSSCPSFWWNPEKFVGPAGLLAAYRFIADSRDTATEERLSGLEDPFSLFRCRGIMNCVSVCPKGLNPTQAIGKIRSLMLKQAS